jgi:hypothetical protein
MVVTIHDSQTDLNERVALFGKLVGHKLVPAPRLDHDC